MKDKAALSKPKWSYIIVDEGHRMKNSQCKFSTVLAAHFTSNYRLILTGTPLQVGVIAVGWCALVPSFRRKPAAACSSLGFQKLQRALFFGISYCRTHYPSCGLSSTSCSPTSFRPWRTSRSGSAHPSRRKAATSSSVTRRRRCSSSIAYTRSLSSLVKLHKPVLQHFSTAFIHFRFNFAGRGAKNEAAIPTDSFLADLSALPCVWISPGSAALPAASPQVRSRARDPEEDGKHRALRAIALAASGLRADPKGRRHECRRQDRVYCLLLSPRYYLY